jgi:hypothetical protein
MWAYISGRRGTEFRIGEIFTLFQTYKFLIPGLSEASLNKEDVQFYGTGRYKEAGLPVGSRPPEEIEAAAVYEEVVLLLRS